ncbi:MAG: elongation factor P [Gammaproteobacteria bacterium]
MATYTSNEFKAGAKVIIDGAPCSILEIEFVKPGKGQAFNRVKYRNLTNGKTLERTFKSTETFERADVQEIDADFLYADDSSWHFMDPNSFEQYTASAAIIGNTRYWLTAQASCQLTLHQGNILVVTPPNFVDLEVVEATPGVKGDTATGGSKKVVLEGGGEIEVPLFVTTGDKLRIDTRTGKYSARSKG